MELDYKTILLQLCASLTRDDHMGAVWDDVETALNLAGIETGNGGATEIANILGNMGISTFSGSVLSGDEYEYNN